MTLEELSQIRPLRGRWRTAPNHSSSAHFIVDIDADDQPERDPSFVRGLLSYQHTRTHLSLDKGAPETRPVQDAGRIVAAPQVGGLHHRYERQAV